MDVKLLTQTAACSRYGEIKALRLVSDDKIAIFAYALMDKIKEAVQKEADLLKLIEEEFEQFPLDAFSTKAEACQVREQERLKFFRLVHFLENMGECITVNARYKVPVYGAIVVNSSPVQSVTGTVDFIYRKDDVVTALLISPFAPVHSVKAHKFCNKVDSNIDLISAKLGLETMYPHIVTTCYHMIGKSDANGNVATFCEADNLVSTDFNAFIVNGALNRKRLISHLSKVVDSQEKKDCSSCRERDICRLGAVREPVESAAVVKKRVTTFTNAQLQAVEHKDGPLSIVAVPGAGKTAVLTERLVRLVESGVLASEILFATFANKACDEIRDRVRSFLPEGAELPEILTLNALGFKILRENRAILGRLRLADDMCRLDLIKEALNIAPLMQGVSYRAIEGKFGLLRMLDSAFQNIDESGVEQYKERHPKIDIDGLLKVKAVYDALYRKGGYIGFDDQITLAVELLKTYPSILKKYQEKYRYIMVDEYQDTDGAQVELVRLLGKHKNVVVVGDDDQCIYGFRKCSNRYLLEFDRYFPGAKQLVLGDNFRSRGGIISSFASFIGGNKERCKKTYQSHRKDGVMPVMYKNYSKEQVIDYIQSALNAGYKLGDIALISRNNKSLIEWGDYLSGFYKVAAPKDYLIDDTVFIILKAVLSLCLDNRNGNGCDKELYQLLVYSGISVPYKNKENSSCNTLYERMMLQGMPYHGTDITLGNAEGTQHKLIQFSKKLRASLLEVEYFSGDFDRMIRTLSEIWFGFSSHPVVEHFIRFCDEQSFNNVGGLLYYLQKLVVYGSSLRVGYEPDPDSITLLTAHDSKGKEFPVVLICDVEDFSYVNEGEKQEERRLFFVAMSRAKDNLALFSSPNGKSSFVAELASLVNVA